MRKSISNSLMEEAYHEEFPLDREIRLRGGVLIGSIGGSDVFLFEDNSVIIRARLVRDSKYLDAVESKEVISLFVPCIGVPIRKRLGRQLKCVWFGVRREKLCQEVLRRINNEG